MSKFEQLEDGEAYCIEEDESLCFGCCDCGMVHHFDIACTGKRIYLRVTQQPRKTGQLRRNRFGNLHRGVRKWKLVRNY